ncbi:ABC transporter permease subunit [Mycoplasma sp. E35C]|uniref:ABC transporter permease subunit n=1 Tax=Mycoplasma sp. E35C TaxID=2801918 RepID=UPI002107F4A2|nr:ABC transporter permease subunit [Mycoplasma sp. E35C]
MHNKFFKILKINKFTVFFACFLILFIISLAVINVNFNAYGITVFKNNFLAIFDQSKVDSSSLLIKTFSYLWTTIKYVVTGTVIGFSLGCFLGYLSALKITNNLTAWLLKLTIIFFRSFPVVIFINLFNSSFNSDLSALIIIGWFSMLWAAKYISDYIENSKIYQFELSLMRSQNKIQAFLNNIYVDIKTKILVLFAYSLESNFRWTTVLSAVGLLGLGQLINDPIKLNNFGEILIPLIVLMIFLLINEMILFLFEKYLIKRKSYDPKKDVKKQIFIKKIVSYWILLSLIIFSLYSILSINLKTNNLLIFTDFFERLFNFNKSFYTIKSFNQNPILLLINLTLQTVLILGITLILGIIFAVISSNLVNKYVSIFFKSLFLIIRTIPIIILFRIFNPLFNSGISTIAIIGSFHISTSLSKRIYESINSLNWTLIDNMKTKLYTNWEILKLYVIPSIKKDLITIYSLEFESILRLLIILGAYGTSVIGQLIDSFIYRDNIKNLGSYTIAIMVYFQLIDLISLAIRYKKINFFYTS